MKYTIVINQVKSAEWGLNLTQAALFAYCFELPSWAENQIIGKDIFYFSSKNKVLQDMPLLTDKVDTVYRILKQLEEKGLIIVQKVGVKDFIKLNPICKEWALKSEINPGSEINPSLLGNKSGSASEINPTNYTISSISISDNSNGQSPAKKISPEEKLQIEKADFFRMILNYVKANPNKYPKLLYLEFCRYWIEKSRGGQKMRFQGEKYFDLGRRLSTWFQGKICQERLSSFWEKEKDLPGIDKLLKEQFEKN